MGRLMKTMKRKGFWVLACFAYSSAFGQSVGVGTELNILNNENFDGYELLDSAVAKARVIMTGENHTYVNFNNKMELKTLRYLNKTIGLRDFVIELGGARACFLNRYINDEDTMAEKFLKATTSPRYMDLFKRLRKFNLSLSDSLRIRVHGIDVERFNDLPLMRLAELLPDSQVPSRLYAAVDAVEMASAHLLRSGLEDYETARNESGSGRYNEPVFYVGRSINEFLRYYDSLKLDFQSWLGSDFEEVNKVVGWLREYKQWREFENTTYQYIWREEGIYKNFSALIKSRPNNRFYGEFGRCHVAYQEQNGDCGWYGYHSVINKLRTRYFKNDDSVLTIGLFYYGSSDNSYYTDKDENDDVQDEIDELIDNTDKKTVTLFNLRDEDTDMPLLSKKFSYAVVNNHFAMDDEDSLESEVITNANKVNGQVEPYVYYAYGYMGSNINRDVLGNYVASNGYATSLAPIGFQQVSLGNSSRLSSELRYGWLHSRLIHEDTAGKLKYGINTVNVRAGYSFIYKSRIQVNLGADISYNREKMTLTQDNGSFLNPRKSNTFVNKASAIGPSLQVNLSLGSMLYLGFQTSYMTDLSNGQWYYQGSKQIYGPEKGVTAGFTGLYYGGFIGFRIPLDEYGGSYDYVTEE